jgi:flavin-dependent thymidylate synthase
MTNEDKQLTKYADVAMFKAAPIDAKDGPRVQLLSCNNDPLGTIAAAAKMYKGEYVESLSLISDDERRHYLSDVRKNVLAAPLEFVNFHFIISGVTRGFTHQMVRQRTATYTQESTRFAVKEDVPIGLPPSLAGTLPWLEFVAKNNQGWRGVDDDDWHEQRASREQLWRKLWDQHVASISTVYNGLIDSGMPAEDARGLLPTNLLTRINYNTSLRGLLEHSGLRLCTQAQFEWRLVWMKMIEAIKKYGENEYYSRPWLDENDGPTPTDGIVDAEADWQFNELATIFKPICYQKGSCQFLSDVDRHCTIRNRVQAFAAVGVPSSSWSTQPGIALLDRTMIPGIYDSEWMLDPTAARVSQ